MTTHSARVGADALGVDFQGMLDVVLAITAADFYKSMTTHADHTIWTVIDNVLIVSFKEL